MNSVVGPNFKVVFAEKSTCGSCEHCTRPTKNAEHWKLSVFNNIQTYTQSKQFSCQYEDVLIPSEIKGRLSRSCKTNRISQKWENLLKSRKKKFISSKTRKNFILLILKFYVFIFFK